MTERISQNILSLPMFPELTDEQVDYVVEKIRAYCQTHDIKKAELAVPPNQVPNLR